MIRWFIGAIVLGFVLLFVLIMFIRKRYESMRLEELINRRTVQLESQHKMLQMVNLTATAMLSSVDDENFEDSFLTGMKLICQTMGVDRVGIWRNEIINGEFVPVLRYERLSEYGKTLTPVPIGLKLNLKDKARWKDKLLCNEHFCCTVSELTQEDQDFFSFYEIKSVVFIPLFLQDNFWGLFSIDDCRYERRFTDEEINILRSASLMMVNAINRHEQSVKVREADILTQLMLDATPISCHLWDRFYNCITCNEATIRLYKLTGKQDFSDRFYELSPEHQPCGRSSIKLVHKYFKKVFDEGFMRFEWMHKRLDGELFPAEVILVRVMHKREYIVAGYTRDLTEYKAMLSEMQKAEDDLRVARDAAEAASYAKSVFLANMSHEIRTPMNSIMGFSELAMDGETSPRTKDYLEKIYTNAEWLLQIINDILDFSKIESGKMELERIPFNINELFSSCRNLILPKAVEKGISLQFFAERGAGKRPIGDPTRLRQVLINLLSNAVKFTKTGAVTLRSSVIDKSNNTITLSFSVTDSGIGMTPEQISAVFDPFAQGETGTTRKYGGTGLGLPISKNIVEMMGGKLLVESTPGIGSTFSFVLTFDTMDISEDETQEEKNTQTEGDKKLQQNLQTLFLRNNRGKFKEIDDALKANDIKLAHRLVHTLKSNAGQIGNTVLQEAAADVEQQLNDGENNVTPQQLVTLEIELNAAVLQLEVELKLEFEEMARTSRFDQQWLESEDALELLETLHSMLKNGHTDSLKLINDLRAIRGSEEMVQQIQDYDFEPALISLEKLREQIKAGTGDRMANRYVHGVSVNDSQETQKIFEKLEALLKCGNVECLDLIDDLRTIPGSEKLIQQIDDFEFDEAVITLEGLRKLHYS